MKERQAAENAELQEWLDTQPEVIVSSHGGAYPEQWEGTVDGHSFYFRERWGDWSLELDPRHTGRPGRAATWAAGDGDITTEEVEFRRGDVIAAGDTGADGYGEKPCAESAVHHRHDPDSSRPATARITSATSRRSAPSSAMSCGGAPVAEPGSVKEQTHEQ